MIDLDAQEDVGAVDPDPESLLKLAEWAESQGFNEAARIAREEAEYFKAWFEDHGGVASS